MPEALVIMCPGDRGNCFNIIDIFSGTPKRGKLCAQGIHFTVSGVCHDLTWAFRYPLLNRGNFRLMHHRTSESPQFNLRKLK